MGIVIYQLLPNDRTESWMSLHSNTPRKTEWQKPEEIKTNIELKNKENL